MEFDVASTPAASTYKLLTSLVVPRPIAWVVTQNARHGINAAPFSFFNVLSDEPPLVALGLGRHGERVHDTTLNIRELGEFVVNLVAEDQLTAMTITAAAFERGESELAAAGVKTEPSTKVRPPRIADSPASFECEHFVTLDVSPRSSIVLGRIVVIHVQDDLFSDPARAPVDINKMRLISRMGGGGSYGRTRDSFQVPP
jgi:flavin reductase (DIM6/NTAB) family NADH-FMN oxidoreductase RutF